MFNISQSLLTRILPAAQNRRGKDNMKKIILMALIIVLLSGCSKQQYNKQIINDQENKISQLKSEIEELKKIRNDLDNTIIDLKEEKGVANYIIGIEIKQSHVFWDVSDNIKDEMNAIEIEIPVSKEYYDAVEIGTVINDDFRAGSLIMSNSIGSWDIKISNKEIR